MAAEGEQQEFSVPSWVRLLKSSHIGRTGWMNDGIEEQNKETDSYVYSYPEADYTFSVRPLSEVDYTSPLTRPTPTYICLSHLSGCTLQYPPHLSNSKDEDWSSGSGFDSSLGTWNSRLPASNEHVTLSANQTEATNMGESEARHGYFRFNQVHVHSLTKKTSGSLVHHPYDCQQTSLAISGSIPGSLGHVTQLGLPESDHHQPPACLRELPALETYSRKNERTGCGRHTRVVSSVIVVMALAIIGLVAALAVSVITKQDEENGLNGHPVVRAFVSLKILNKNFTSGMQEYNSEEFYGISKPYSQELDRLFLTSPMADIYRGNKIVSLSQGSIKADAELLFLDKGLIRDSQAVENVISSADRAHDWRESDAREMGEFVVCGDCVKVAVNFTTIHQLPEKPNLTHEVMLPLTSTELPEKPKVSTGPSENLHPMTPEGMTTKISVTSSHPFLQDGHFIVACDITNVTSWSSLTIEFAPQDSASWKKAGKVKVVFFNGSFPDKPRVSEAYHARLVTFLHSEGPGSLSVVMNVSGVTCRDRGAYICSLVTSDGQQYEGSGDVEIQELPTIPVITATKKSPLWDATPEYSCTAKLGYPPGNLTFRAANHQGPTFDPVVSNLTRTGDTCDSQVVITVSAVDPAFRNATRVVCQVSSVHLNLLDSTQYATVHPISVSRKLEIQTKSTSINDGLAAIRCRLLNLGSWQKLTLYKMAPSSSLTELISMFPNRTTRWLDFSLSQRALTVVDVSDRVTDLDVFIHSLKCADEGRYACAVQASGVSITMPSALLTVTAKPSAPDLRVPADAVENELVKSPITCQATVGRPAGSLVLKVKNPGEKEFRHLAFNEQTTRAMSCSTAMWGIFYPTTGIVNNASIFSCGVIPNESLARDLTVKLDVSETFYILAANYCEGAGVRNVSHPTDCRHYVTCTNDVITNVSKCGDGLCFDPATGDCTAQAPSDNSYDRTKNICYPDKDYITYPHVDGCHLYIQCDLGRELIQHCPKDAIFASGMDCTVNVRASQCYSVMDTTTGVVSNSTDLLTR